MVFSFKYYWLFYLCRFWPTIKTTSRPFWRSRRLDIKWFVYFKQSLEYNHKNKERFSVFLFLFFLQNKEYDKRIGVHCLFFLFFIHLFSSFLYKKKGRLPTLLFSPTLLFCAKIMVVWMQYPRKDLTREYQYLEKIKRRNKKTYFFRVQRGWKDNFWKLFT